jgi:RNA polymerase sigma-70 factor (ECF subfamily)
MDTPELCMEPCPVDNAAGAARTRDVIVVKPQPLPQGPRVVAVTVHGARAVDRRTVSSKRRPGGPHECACRRVSAERDVGPDQATIKLTVAVSAPVPAPRTPPTRTPPPRTPTTKTPTTKTPTRMPPTRTLSTGTLSTGTLPNQTPSAETSTGTVSAETSDAPLSNATLSNGAASKGPAANGRPANGRLANGPSNELDPNDQVGMAVPRLTAVDDPASSDSDTNADEIADDEIDDASRSNTADAWDLVRRTQGGDPEAFGLLYDRYVDTVYRFVYYRLGDRTQAEDITSETFLRALRRISTVHEQGRDIGAWLVTIARNLVLDHVKSAQYRLSVPTEEIVEAHLEQAGDTTEAAVLAALDQRALLEAVRLLPPDQQESIALRFFQGLSLAEAAEVMGRNAGAVKALQHRAMQRLHILLTSPAPKPVTGAAAEAPQRALPARFSPRGPPVTEDPTFVRKRYRSRHRRNH